MIFGFLAKPETTGIIRRLQDILYVLDFSVKDLRSKSIPQISKWGLFPLAFSSYVTFEYFEENVQYHQDSPGL